MSVSSFSRSQFVFAVVFIFAWAMLTSAFAGSAQDLEVLDCSSGTMVGSAASFDCANATGGSTSYGIIAAPSVYNPVTTADTASEDIQDPFVAGGFNNLANGGAGTVPAVASVIEISVDGTTVTYTLRDAQYSDGSSVAVTDVLYWYEDVVNNPNLPNSSTASFTCPDGSPFSVSAPDASTIQVSCADLFRTFSANAGAMYVLSQQMALDLIEDQGIATEDGVIGPRATSEFMGLGVDISLIRGLGPFQLTEFDSQSLARFERNPFHYQVDSNGTRLPYLDSLEIILIPTQGQNLNLSNFLAGQTDVINPRPSDIGPIFGAAAGGSVTVNSDIDNGTASPETTFITLNYDDGDAGKAAAARNPRVRHALSLAIDRVAAVNNVLLGIGAPQYSPISLSGSSLTTFFLGRNNTCGTFASLGLPCDDATGLMTVRSGLNVQVQQLPPLGVNANMDQHLSCLADLQGCIDIANGILDDAGLTDSDGDGTRNLSDGSSWDIQIVTNSGNTVREGYTQIICDGWVSLGINCSASSTSFGTLVTQLLGLGGATWTGGIVIGLTGGDPAAGSNAYRCGQALYFWHLSCDPDSTSGPTAQLPEDASMQAGFDQGYNAVSVADAQAGFDIWQGAWYESQPFFHIAVQNALFAVRTDRLCNDGRSIDGFTDIKFRVDVPGNENACSSNVGRLAHARQKQLNPQLPTYLMPRGTCTVRLTPW